MSFYKPLSLATISLTFILLAIPIQGNAAKNTKVDSGNEKLVLMPLRVPDEDRNLTGSMETALVNGLQRTYDVFSGERVAQKAHEIFMKESRNLAHKECDETRCMQNIAGAFQSELIATANVSKQDGNYFLALSIQNVFDNKVVYSESLTCKKCDATEVIEKLKNLSANTKSKINIKFATSNDEVMNVPPAKLSAKTGENSQYALNANNYFSLLALAQTNDVQAQYLVAVMYEYGIGTDIDGKQAIEWYTKAAANGSVAAETALAWYNENPIDNTIPLDKKVQEQSLLVYKKNAEKNDPLAQFALANDSDDKSKADKWFAIAIPEMQRLAKEGNPKYQFLLAKAYLWGAGIEKNPSKAVFWLKKASAQGNTVALASLSNAYYLGNGTAKNQKLGFDALQKSALRGSVNSQFHIGEDYLNGDDGVAENREKGIEWLEKAASKGFKLAQDILDAYPIYHYQKPAENGDIEAQLMMGYYFLNGNKSATDHKKAFYWYEKAAKSGNRNAQYQLGEMYRTGDGIFKDLDESIKWTIKSASQGFAPAQYSLAWSYRKGEGVVKNEAEAFDLNSKAALQGDVDAQYILCLDYEIGKLVNKDLVLSYAWCNLAAAKGNTEAKKFRDDTHLSDRDRAEAERMSAAWSQGKQIVRENAN